MKTMKNFKRRAIALLLAVLMCLSMMNLTVFAEETDAAEETNEEVYICGLEEHTHNDECYEKQIAKELVCENEDEGHEHTDECYAPVLDCGLEEGEGAHTHTDDCYGIETKTTDKQVLTCELAESDPVEASEGHAHTEDCYTVTETRELTCELAESEATEDTEGHTHGEDCYAVTETRELTCELAESDPVEAKEGHTHGEDCYVTVPETVDEKVLKCELEESEGHAHTEDCYKTEDVLVCELVEHTHTAACYAVVKEFIDKVNALPYTAETLPEEMPQDELDALMADLEALLALYEKVQDVPDVDEYEAFTTAFGKVSELWEAIEKVTPETMAEVDSLDALKDQMNSDGKLKNDVTVKSTIVIEGDFTLDLNGHTVTYTGATGSVFMVSKYSDKTTTAGNFTLKDSVGTGKITGGKGMAGGTAKYNAFGLDSNNTTAGGGVFVGVGGVFTMYSGSIEGNTAGRGGGIYVDINTDHSNPGQLFIYGGSIKNNTATAGEGMTPGNVDGGGGGMWITGKATINPNHEGGSTITITGNESKTTGDLGGGGIYVNNDGSLTIHNAVITDNTAAGLGGGIAGCNHSKISLVNLSPGAAVYQNHIGGAPLNRRGSNPAAVDHFSDWQNDADFKAAAVDIFSASIPLTSSGNQDRGTVIGNQMGSNWEGYVSTGAGQAFHKVVATKDTDVIYGRYLLGLTAKGTPSVGGNYVDISKNKSASHGGGIACNGIINSSGETAAKELNGDITLTVPKTLSGFASWGDGFTFQLLDDNKAVLEEKKVTREASSATFTIGKYIDVNKIEANQPYTFYVKEKVDGADYEPKNEYTITFTIVADTPATYTHTVKGVNPETGAETTYSVLVYRYKIDTPTVTDKDGKSIGVTTSTQDGSAIVSGIEEKYTITNYDATLPITNEWKTDGQLTISKALVNPTLAKAGEQFTFKITLTDDDHKGITLPTGTYNGVTFTDGVSGDVILMVTEDGTEPAPVTITGLPVGLHYTVTETSMPESYQAQGNVTTTGDTIVSGTNTAEITNERKTGDLVISKKVVSTTPLLPSETFVFTVELKDGDTPVTGTFGDYTFDEDGKVTVTINGRDFLNEDGTWKNTNKEASVTITGIPTGTTWTVTEVVAEVANHELTGTNGENGKDPTGTISDTTENKAVFINTRKTGNLSITKIVEGLETAQQGVEHTFTFTVAAQGGAAQEVAEHSFKLDPDPTESEYVWFNEQGVAEVQIEVTGNESETKTIKGLPTGIYTVEEINTNTDDVTEAHYTLNVEGNGAVEVKQDTTENATIINTYGRKSPTDVTLQIVKKLDGPTSSTNKFTFKIEGTTVYGKDVEETVEITGAGVGSIALTKGTYTVTEVTDEIGKETYFTWDSVKFTSEDEAKRATIDGNKVTIDLTDANSNATLEVTATNTYTRDLGDLIIDKTVVNNTPLAADEVFKFEVTLTPVAGETLPETLKDSDGNEYKVVDGKFTVTISGIELNSEYRGNKSVTIKGIPTGTKYAVTEVDAGKWIVTSENGEGTIVSAGSKAEITNTYRPQVNTTRLSVKKVWKGDGDIERPASVTVQLYRNGQASTRNDAVQTLSASNNWSYTWTGLNENYSWSVDEVDVPEGYTREVTESGTRFTITNTYTEPEIPEDPTPLTSLLSVSKVWVGDAGENRPASVSVQFYKDGERAETVTLNDANGWSWSRVLSKEELASKWTVSEVEVPAGYTSVVTTGEDGISFTVTNTFTTTPETPDEPETPDIPDEETPKTDTPDEPVDVPDEQPPLAEIPDEQPPLVDWPPLAEIPEEQPPLVEVPEEIPLIPAEPEVVVPEEPVPMVGIPQTGDFSMVWYAVAILSALGLVVLALKKREDSKD